MSRAERTRLTGGATRIVSRLWQGPLPPTGDALARAGFTDLFLCALEYQPPAGYYAGLRVHRCPLDDSGHPMLRSEIRDALAAGQAVAQLLRSGARVLVTCAQGRNRSGLVVALALMNQGASAAQAIGTVRATRGAALPAHLPPLSNVHFLSLLHGAGHLARQQARA